MPSIYSTNLALELIATGEKSGTWGAVTNTNLGTLLEQAISGYTTQAITDGADTTITIPNGSTGVARNMFIEATGTLTAARNLVVPANKKLYFIYNNTTGGYAVTVKVSGQTGVSVPNGKKMLLVCDGTDVRLAVTQITAGAVDNSPVGATTPSTGAFTTLSASSTVSGAGFSTYLASPPAIGGSAAAAGSFTTLSASSTVSGSGFSTYLASPPAIGGTAAAAGSFTTLTASSSLSGAGVTAAFASPPAGIGSGTPVAGTFTNVTTGGNYNSSNINGVTHYIPSGKFYWQQGSDSIFSLTYDSGNNIVNLSGLPAGGGSGSNLAIYAKTDGQVYIGSDTRGGGFCVAAPTSGGTAGVVQVAGPNASYNAYIKATAYNLVLGGGAALATNATAGHVMIPTCAGTPTGVPTNSGAGQAAIIYDTTANKLWIYNGGWRSAAFA